VVILEIKAPEAVDDEAMTQILVNIKMKARLKIVLLWDLTAVQDYDMSAHRIFVAWATHNRKRIDRIAVLTDHPIWDALVSVLSKESQVTSRAFSSRDFAIEWLERPCDLP